MIEHFLYRKGIFLFGKSDQNSPDSNSQPPPKEVEQNPYLFFLSGLFKQFFKLFPERFPNLSAPKFIDFYRGEEHCLYYPINRELFHHVLADVGSADLHTHLEGGLPISAVKAILAETEVHLEDSTIRGYERRMSGQDKDFSGFLAMLATGALFRILKKAIIEGKDPIEVVKVFMRTFLKRAIEDNVRYIEIFVSPFALCREGDLDPKYQARKEGRLPEETTIDQTWEKNWSKYQVKAPSLEQLIQAYHEVTQEPEIKEKIEAVVKISLRRFKQADQLLANHNLNTPEAKHLLTVIRQLYLDGHLAGVDLGGWEAAVRLFEFSDLLAKLSLFGIPITAHVDEIPPDQADKVKGNFDLALELGVDRIGHGTDLFREKSYHDFIKWFNWNLLSSDLGRKPIQVEVSVRSNEMTGVHPGGTVDHPLIAMVRGDNEWSKSRPEEMVKLWRNWIVLVSDDIGPFGPLSDQMLRILRRVTPYVYPEIEKLFGNDEDALRYILQEEFDKSYKASLKSSNF